MEKEVLKKISKKDIKVNLFFITLLLVYIINANNFLNYKSVLMIYIQR